MNFLADTAQMLKPPFMQRLVKSILRTAEPKQIETLALSFASEQLNLNTPRITKFELSVGAVFHLIDTDGTKALMKVLSPDNSLEDALKRYHFQQFAFQSGYPCPLPLIEPQNFEELTIVAEAYLETGRVADGHLDADRKLLADCFAELVQLGSDFPAEGFPREALIQEPGELWPKPHNVLFDFNRRTRLTDWIDAVAAQHQIEARDAIAGHFIAHLDWAAKHCRIAGNKVSAVYDWDSTAYVPETKAVGDAIRGFTYKETGGRPKAPNIEQMVSFLTDYETARQRRFTPHENEELVSYLIYGAAYGARCEDSIDDGSARARTENREFLKLLEEADLVSAFIRR